MAVIKILLILSALYGFGMWAYVFITLSILGRTRIIDDRYREQIALFTFHLGICAIAASGFLGIILAIEGH